MSVHPKFPVYSRPGTPKGVFQSPRATIGVVNRLINEFQVANRIHHMSGKKHKETTRGCKWIPPGRGLHKLNVDASLCSTKGAVAVVCRNDQGRFVAASVMVCPTIRDIETLEAIACAEALALAEDCGIRKIKVASDRLNVVNNIKEIPRCSYMMILRDIQERAKAFDCVQFMHEGRDCNVEAHNLAKLACTFGDGGHVWFTSPPDVLDVNVVTNDV